MNEVTQDLCTNSLTDKRSQDWTPVLKVITPLELIARSQITSLGNKNESAVEHLFEVVKAKERVTTTLSLNDTDNKRIDIAVRHMKLPFLYQTFFPLSTSF